MIGLDNGQNHQSGTSIGAVHSRCGSVVAISGICRGSETIGSVPTMGWSIAVESPAGIQLGTDCHGLGALAALLSIPPHRLTGRAQLSRWSQHRTQPIVRYTPRVHWIRLNPHGEQINTTRATLVSGYPEQHLPQSVDGHRPERNGHHLDGIRARAYASHWNRLNTPGRNG